MSKKRLETFEMWVWRKMERMNRQSNKCSCANKSGRRKNNAGAKEEEKKEIAWVTSNEGTVC